MQEAHQADMAAKAQGNLYTTNAARETTGQGVSDWLRSTEQCTDEGGGTDQNSSR
jgi:hypothetical protein